MQEQASCSLVIVSYVWRADRARACRAYDPVAFRAWASRAICPGIPAMQWLLQTLRSRGFRVFVVTGRDEETLGSCTAANLAAAGFSGYDRLIMRYGS